MDEVEAYKRAKEAFVSNFSGSSILNINIATAVAPSSVLLWSALQYYQGLFTPYTPVARLVDFLLNFVTILLAITAYSGHLIYLNLLLLCPVPVIILLSNLAKAQGPKPIQISKRHSAAKSENESLDALPPKAFVTTYRGTMMVITCASILAVDFKVFPRRFVKTENWGTSLMDLGVGSFVFSAGIVAARPILKQHMSNQRMALWMRLKTSFRRSLPLLVLGLLRLYSVKELEYAEHVSEYGVHWNFFFTLAMISPFVAVFDSAFRLVPSYAVFSLLIGSCYEVVLAFTDLKGFILTAPRVDLLSKNREGLFSIVGYLAIFLAGQGTGMSVLSGKVALSPQSSDRKVLEKLIKWSLIWVSLFFFATNYKFGLNLQVSRRLANLSYILWVCAFNTCQLTLFCGIERLWFTDMDKLKKDRPSRSNDAVSPLLRALNRNGLAIFLLANLLTGLVNLTLPTISMGNFQAMSVLILYSMIISAVALLLDSRNISIKL